MMFTTIKRGVIISEMSTMKQGPFWRQALLGTFGASTVPSLAGDEAGQK